MLLLDEPTEGVWHGVIEEITERLRELARGISRDCGAARKDGLEYFAALLCDGPGSYRSLGRICCDMRRS